MRKLLLLLIAPVLGFGQGEQRYADGTATDQDGNTFEWINYGTQDWSIENAEVVTYRDGTEIPQVTNFTEWYNLTTGAWCYYDNDPSKGKLYNWYAIQGIYDETSLNDESLRKDFAPNGWHLASEAEWDSLVLYLVEGLYNFDNSPIYEGMTFDSNKLAKAMALTTDWNTSTSEGAVGNDLSLNNKSGFSIFPTGWRHYQEKFSREGVFATFWVSNIANFSGHPPYYKPIILISKDRYDIIKHSGYKHQGNSVRFVRDASTASKADYSNAITIYPNPTTSILTIESNKDYQIKVYDLLGNKVLETQGNSINMEHLSTATYIVKATDKSNNEELTYKVVKN